MEKNVIGSYGYYQKGNRYYWKVNETINTVMGFTSKNNCNNWIEEKKNQYGLDWRIGFTVKFKSEQIHWILVDKNVRAFVRYSTSNGKWFIECYRKKKKEESKGEHDWQMIREGNIQTYNSRQEAEKKVLQLAEQICLENGF